MLTHVLVSARVCINSVFLYFMFWTAEVFFLLLCSEVSILRKMWSTLATGHKQAASAVSAYISPSLKVYPSQNFKFSVQCFSFSTLGHVPLPLLLYIFSPTYPKPIWWIRFKADFESTCASSTNRPLSFWNCVNQDFQFNISFDRQKIFQEWISTC